MRAPSWLAALLLCLAGPAAIACGHCVEDKVAAVYDHAVVTQARAQRHGVAYFAIEGDGLAGEPMRRALEQAAQRSDGAIPGSVRVSLELAALSLAFDPRRTSYPALRQAIQRKLASRHLRLQELKLVVAEPGTDHH